MRGAVPVRARVPARAAGIARTGCRAWRRERWARRTTGTAPWPRCAGLRCRAAAGGWRRCRRVAPRSPRRAWPRTAGSRSSRRRWPHGVGQLHPHGHVGRHHAADQGGQALVGGRACAVEVDPHQLVGASRCLPGGVDPAGVAHGGGAPGEQAQHLLGPLARAGPPDAVAEVLGDVALTVGLQRWIDEDPHPPSQEAHHRQRRHLGVHQLGGAVGQLLHLVLQLLEDAEQVAERRVVGEHPREVVDQADAHCVTTRCRKDRNSESGRSRMRSRASPTRAWLRASASNSTTSTTRSTPSTPASRG